MTARENATKRLNGNMDGSEWAKVDGIKGIGWALLHLADTIAESVDKVVAARPLIGQQNVQPHCKCGHAKGYHQPGPNSMCSAEISRQGVSSVCPCPEFTECTDG